MPMRDAITGRKSNESLLGWRCIQYIAPGAPKTLTGQGARSDGMSTPRNQSVQKAFTLLQSFRGPDEWVTNAELSRRAHLSEAAAHRLMRTLEEIGVVIRNSRGCYRPGMLLASLSKNVAIGDLVRVTSHQDLNDLASRMKAVVHVGILENGMVTYTAKAGDPACIPVLTQVGSQLEAYCSALGKVLLAGLPQDQLEEFLRDGRFVALTDRTITDVSDLRAEIGRVRERGYAVDDREISQSVYCIGVPILDPHGQTIAAISIADTPVHVGPQRDDNVRHALLSAASSISRKMFPSSAASLTL
jgi:IclR family acetate operon transcriptional repressor